MQYDTYGKMQNVSGGNSPGLGRYIKRADSHLKNYGLVDNSWKDLVHFKEKVKIKAPCCLEKLKAIGIVGI